MLYDWTDPAMRKAAYQCSDEPVTEFSAEGYGSYRTNTAFMDKVADSYGPVQRSVNHTLRKPWAPTASLRRENPASADYERKFSLRTTKLAVRQGHVRC